VVKEKRSIVKDPTKNTLRPRREIQRVKFYQKSGCDL
jgi:hypothetical protein